MMGSVSFASNGEDWGFSGLKKDINDSCLILEELDLASTAFCFGVDGMEMAVDR